MTTNSSGRRNNTQHLYALAIQNIGMWKPNWVDVFIHSLEDYETAGVTRHEGIDHENLRYLGIKV